MGQLGDSVDLDQTQPIFTGLVHVSVTWLVSWDPAGLTNMPSQQADSWLKAKEVIGPHIFYHIVL